MKRGKNTQLYAEACVELTPCAARDYSKNTQNMTTPCQPGGGNEKELMLIMCWASYEYIS